MYYKTIIRTRTVIFSLTSLMLLFHFDVCVPINISFIHFYSVKTVLSLIKFHRYKLYFTVFDYYMFKCNVVN